MDTSDRVEEERVLFVDVFWDVPQTGIANFSGAPHSFDCIFDEEHDDWSNEYLLRPLDHETVARVLAEWQELRKHPPDDERQHRDVVQSLRSQVQPDPNTAFRAVGQFRHVTGKGLESEYAVRWTPLDDGLMSVRPNSPSG